MGAERMQDAALAVVQATSVPIHDIGTSAYLSPDIAAWAAEWGWSNPFAFYFAGRGGMLGDVGADVVTSALGWFAPGAVHSMYSDGISVAGPSGAAARMAEAHGKWGEKHYGGVEGVEKIVAVTEVMVDGLEESAFLCSWGGGMLPGRIRPPGRAAQLMQILREWRGGTHLVATTAVRLSPLEAILTNEGPGQAKFFGGRSPSRTLRPSSNGTPRQRRSRTGSARRHWQQRSTRRGSRSLEPGTALRAAAP